MSRPPYYGNPAGVTDDLAVVRAIYDAFDRRDLERALAHFADDCELHIEGTANIVGRSEPYRGVAGVREYFADVGRAWDALTLHADDFRAVPGSVIVMGHVEGRQADRVVVRATVWTWRLRGLRVVTVRVSDVGELRR